MLRVNFKDMPWEKGLTVEKLLQKLKKDRSYSIILQGKVTVIVNNNVIAPLQYSNTELQDGDDIRIYPAIAGG